MKILCISDTHNKHPDPKNIPEVDVLIFAGDATFRGFDDEWNLFKNWIKNVKADHKIWIPGNHDINPPIIEGVTRLEGDKVHDVEGLKIWGWSGSAYRNPGEIVTDDKGRDWWYNWQNDRSQEEKFAEIPENLDILVTHTPPLFIRDLCPNGNVGDPSLREALLKLKNPPKLHVFGHIHESAGITIFRNTICVNASWLDGQYDVINPNDFRVIYL